jgi:hypothetical protein
MRGSPCWLSLCSVARRLSFSAAAMKAISLWQPWATAIALGIKRVETRSWSTKYRGPLAIHAGKKLVRREDIPEGLDIRCRPLGAIVAICELVEVRLMDSDLIAEQHPCEIRWGDWRVGRYAWILENVRSWPLVHPIPFRGRQGLFDVPDELLRIGVSPSLFSEWVDITGPLIVDETADETIIEAARRKRGG